MAKLIYLLFLCREHALPKFKLLVQLLMSVPVSKTANESTAALLMSLFRQLKLQLRCTSVEESQEEAVW